MSPPFVGLHHVDPNSPPNARALSFFIKEVSLCHILHALDVNTQDVIKELCHIVHIVKNTVNS